MDRNERDIITRCQNGSAEDFGRLYDAHVRRIYEYLYYRLLHRETAEDLASQVFLKALEKIGTFDPDKGPFRAWLYGIAKNALTDHFRARRATVDIDDVWDLASDEDVAADAESKLLRERLQPYMKLLSADQREVVLLRLWDGHSHAEIAALTGRTEAASKMAFSRAIARLRKELPGSFLAALALLLLSRPPV